MATLSAAGVTFRAYDGNHLACNDCDTIVARPSTPWGIKPEDHVCR